MEDDSLEGEDCLLPVLFTPDSKQARLKPRMFFSDTTPVKHEPFPVFLGLVFDRTMSFTKHTNEVKRRMLKRVNALRALTGTSWGADTNTLRVTYKSYVEPVALYGLECYGVSGTAICDRPVNREPLLKAQRNAAKVISGCVPGTPNDLLLVESKLTPINVLATQAAATATERYMRMPASHPTRIAMERTISAKQKLKSRRSWPIVGSSVAEKSGLNRLPREPNWESPCCSGRWPTSRPALR